MATYRVSTFTFTVIHRSDEPEMTLEWAMRESFDGGAVGAETAAVHKIGLPLSEAREVLLELGNDGEFFDLDFVPTDSCQHCGRDIAVDCGGAWVDDTDGDGCGDNPASAVHQPTPDLIGE